MALAGLQPENIAGKMEREDLAATVTAEAHGANGARNDPVDMVRGLAFAKDFLVALVAHAHALERKPRAEGDRV